MAKRRRKKDKAKEEQPQKKSGGAAAKAKDAAKDAAAASKQQQEGRGGDRGGGSGSGSSSGRGSGSSDGDADDDVYLVDLPHNTLLIMWPPFQEVWKHEVPAASASGSASSASSALVPHPAAGARRVNLTFRMARPAFAARHTPTCRCGRAAVLKVAYKGSAAAAGGEGGDGCFRYFYKCSPTGDGPHCNFFRWLEP